MWAVGMKQRSHLWGAIKQISEKKLWISSSQAASLLYLSKYQSKQKLWRILHGKEKRVLLDWNQAIHHGNMWEYQGIEEAKRYLPDYFVWTRPGIIFDPYSHFCASPDAYGIDPVTMESIGIEVKCPYSRKLPETIEEVDLAHVIQSFVCLMITRAKEWNLFYFNPFDHKENSLWKILPSEKLWNILKNEAAILIQQPFPPHRKNQKEFIEMEKMVISNVGLCKIQVQELDNENSEKSYPNGYVEDLEDAMNNAYIQNCENINVEQDPC
jgi:hypothetical protein